MVLLGLSVGGKPFPLAIPLHIDQRNIWSYIHQCSDIYMATFLNPSCSFKYADVARSNKIVQTQTWLLEAA